MKEQRQVMTSIAKYSEDELYRYSLKKTWDTTKPTGLTNYKKRYKVLKVS